MARVQCRPSMVKISVVAHHDAANRECVRPGRDNRSGVSATCLRQQRRDQGPWRKHDQAYKPGRVALAWVHGRIARSAQRSTS